MSYVIFDLETNGTETFKRFCNPLDPRHSVELSAFKSPDQLSTVWGDDREQIVEMLLQSNPKLLIGQNIKFDLLWLWHIPQLQEWIRNGGMVWDTQTVEYLLQGQTKEKRNLDTLSVRYGGTVKDDRISEFYKQGLQSKDIDKDMLLEYCKHDVLNTETVFLGQKREIAREGMMPLVKTYMEHYLAVVEMEHNGMHIDKDQAWKTCKELEEKLNNITDRLVQQVPSSCWDLNLEFNPASAKHVSALLFGTSMPVKEDVPVISEDGEQVYYKTGKRKGEIKTKKQVVIKAPNSMKISPINKIGKSGWYSVDAKVLKSLELEEPEYREYIDLLLEHREVSKLLSTYYYKEEKISKNKTKVSGNLALVMPHTECMHTEYKTSATRTGRLASRNPNVQNLAPSCLDIFNSRFPNGTILECDFSQLEVCIQAALSLSPKFIEDIHVGIDFHCLRLSYAEDKPYEEVVRLCKESPEWKKKRKKAKIISFQKAYGAQPERIALDAGLPLETVKKVFEKEDIRYPEIPVYYDSVLDQIKQTTRPNGDLLPIRIKKPDGSLLKYTTVNGESQYYGHAYTMFNKKYTFFDRGVLTKRGSVFRYYLMTEVQDYPIQGTAADIVALFVGHLYQLLNKRREHVRIINEVHDSILLDVQDEYLEEVTEIMRDLCNTLPDIIEKRFKVKWPVRLKLDYSTGKNWAECKASE